MLTGKITFTGRRLEDVLDAIEEAKQRIENGSTTGFDTSYDGVKQISDFRFEVDGEEEEEPMNWIEQAPLGPGDEGDTGGDEQYGTAWGRRFVSDRQNEDGEYAVLDIIYYVAVEGHMHGADSGLLLRKQTIYTLCTDPTDVGGTEGWSDITYVRVPHDGELTDEAARRVCADMPVPDATTWDGKPWHNPADAPTWRAGERS